MTANICSAVIDHELLRVLPKQHTPTSGVTLRSLSHHLALHMGSEVVPHWRGMPTELPRGPFNVLLAPWPLAIHRTQFRPKVGTLDDMPRRFGFMTVAEPEDAPSAAQWALELLKAARREVGEVQAVVFPECALSPADFEAVSSVAEEQGVSLMIGGVLERREPYSSNSPA